MNTIREEFIRSFDGTRIYYKVIQTVKSKAKPWLILFDGVGCDGYVWKYIIEDLKGKWNFIHMHYRGHGNSDVP